MFERTPEQLDKMFKKPKFPVGTMVHVKLEKASDFLDRKVATADQFRTGDLRFSKEKYKVKDVLYPSGDVIHRYILEGRPSVSYTEKQLRK